MAAPNECLRIIEEAAAGRLTDDELEAVIEALDPANVSKIASRLIPR